MKWDSWLKRRRWERRMHAEFQFHLDSQINDYLSQGVSRGEAEFRARRDLGSVDLAKEECRDGRPFESLDRFIRDVRYACRSLRKSPGFVAAAVLTLALGIGANTAIFSALKGVVLAPLPYREPDRLVLVLLYNRALKHAIYLSHPDFKDWQRNARSFQQIAAFTPQDYDLTSPGTPEHLTGNEISSGFFGTLGVKPALGHDFSPEVDKHGAAPVAIISNRLWRNRFAGSPAVLGKPITLNGADYMIVGILPPGFRFGAPYADIYTLLGQGNPLTLNNRTVHNIACIARLKSNVSVGQAQAEMNTVQEAIDRLYPSTERGLGAAIIPLKQEFVGDVGQTLLLLLGAVGLVLLIACANVANLCLARSAARAREFAVRLALGASRAHIVRHLITESVLLSLGGGILGLAVAKWGLNAVLAAVPGSLPRSENIGIDLSVLLFAFGVSIAVGILFGLAPALKSSNPDLQTALKEGSRGSTRSHHRAQSSLVIVQIALTLVLLVGASLLFRSVQNLWQVNPGFNTHHVITFKVGLSPSVTKTPSKMRIAYRQLLERIRDVPGVKAADLTTLVPLGGGFDEVPFWVSSQRPASIAEAPRTTAYSTGPDYLRVLGIPLLRGRFFTSEDTVNSAPVVVINSVLAHSYFPDSDPIGKTITFANVGAYRIVGVVGQVRHSGLGDPSSNTQVQTYTPFYQISDRWLSVMHTSTTVVVRTPIGTTTLMPVIRAAVYEVGNDQPIYDIQTMQQIVSESISSRRLPTILLGAFAGLALLLASVGIYGVISYSVTQRVQEIGIRMALGANRRDVLRLIVGQGLRLALPGLAIGIAAALLITRWLSSFSRLLYGVKASDPLTLVIVSLVLIGTALFACYIPARRAANLDSMTALRQE